MELIYTEDGSHTLYLKELNETYHSRHGAIQESMHVFIKNGLRYYLSKSAKKRIRLFELGLGTGLNALLTALEAEKYKCHIGYEVIEPYPVPADLCRQLNYAQKLSRPGIEKLLMDIHGMEWGVIASLSDFFSIRKEKILFEDYRPVEETFDILFYDAFAPGKQAGIWESALLERAHAMLIADGILVTYCAQGKFKRDLKNIGFRIETLIGPPGKKEMVRATK